MTETEKNAISASLLVFATATEMLMQEWLRMEKMTLTGESKMMFNGMTDGIKKAKFYYARLTETYASVLFDMDKDSARLDEMRKDAAGTIRLYLKYLNMDANGYAIESLENAINRLLTNEQDPKILVSEEVIKKFTIK